MAFSSAVIGSGAVFGSGQRVVIGSYTNDGDSTGGDISTGLSTVNFVMLQPKGTSVSANQPVVNETLPLNGTGAVTIVTSANEVGTWMAIGI